MQDGDLSGLKDALKTADDDTIREIIRQAEKFLESQLQSAIAADQRAITFASVTIGVIALLLTGLATLYAADKLDTVPAGIGVWCSLGLGLSAALAVLSSRPITWDYAGSNPRHWKPDLDAGISTKDALAGQAALYAADIIRNRDALRLNAKLMTGALVSAAVTLGVAAAIVIVWFWFANI